MTYRYLKVFRWQIPLFTWWEGGPLINWRGIAVHQIWSRTLRDPRVNGWLGGAKLTHLEHVICQGKWNSGDHPPGEAYEVRYPHGLLHTSQFRLTSDLPIAYVAFSRWDPPETLS